MRFAARQHCPSCWWSSSAFHTHSSLMECRQGCTWPALHSAQGCSRGKRRHDCTVCLVACAVSIGNTGHGGFRQEMQYTCQCNCTAKQVCTPVWASYWVFVTSFSAYQGHEVPVKQEAAYIGRNACGPTGKIGLATTLGWLCHCFVGNALWYGTQNC